MKDSARRRSRSQEATTEQLVFAAMRDARATLHEAVVAAGMSVLSAMLEEDRTKLYGPRYVHDGDRRASRAGHTGGELAMGGRRVASVCVVRECAAPTDGSCRWRPGNASPKPTRSRLEPSSRWWSASRRDVKSGRWRRRPLGCARAAPARAR